MVLTLIQHLVIHCLLNFVNLKNRGWYQTIKNKIYGPPKGKANKSSEKVIVFNDDDEVLDYKLAACCNPIPGDLIFGFLQLGQRRGVFSFEESAKIFECMNQFADFFQRDEEPIPEKEEDDVEKEKEEEELPEENDEKFDSDEEGPPAL